MNHSLIKGLVYGQLIYWLVCVPVVVIFKLPTIGLLFLGFIAGILGVVIEETLNG